MKTTYNDTVTRKRTLVGGNKKMMPMGRGGFPAADMFTGAGFGVQEPKPRRARPKKKSKGKGKNKGKDKSKKKRPMNKRKQVRQDMAEMMGGF